jgi:hypothetical protein
MSDEAFAIGPAEQVTDSRDLPAVSAEDEAAFVHGEDLGEDHPDNEHVDPAVDDEIIVPEPDSDAGEDLPGEDTLDAVVAGVDPDAVDTVGFDDADLVQPLEHDVLDNDASLTGGA